MTSRLGVFLDWSLLDFTVLGIAIWQYFSITRDIKQTKARQAKEQEDQVFFEQAQAAAREAKRLY
jgi:hypothetical protein